MNGLQKAQEALTKSQGHILICADIAKNTAKSLLKTTTITDSRYFDFSQLCKGTYSCESPFFYELNECLFMDTILDSTESTLILDWVEFPFELYDSGMYFLLRTMFGRGKRVITVTYPSPRLEKFRHLFVCEIVIERTEDGKLTYVTNIKE